MATRLLESERIPPHNMEAERSVLGALLLDERLLPRVLERLRREDFYHEGHRAVFETMCLLTEKGRAIDHVTVHEELERAGLLERAGGTSYVAQLADGLPRTVNVDHYAQIVKEKSILRSLIRESHRIIGLCHEAEDDPDEILDQAEKSIFEISEDRLRRGFVPLRQLVQDSYRSLEQFRDAGGGMRGLATGFQDFDELTTGLQRSDLIIVAARPAVGKTSFCLNVAAHAALHAGRKVGVFSLEMSSDQLALRLLCSEARVDMHRVRKNMLSGQEWTKLALAVGKLSSAPIFIDDTPAISVLEIRAKSRKLLLEQGLDLLIIDYLQLMASPGRQENRNQEISAISRALKGLAKELNVPLIALSQLSRAPEARADHRPQLSDLRESGSIEQDADLVAFLYREELYDDSEENEGKAELIVAKQRNGPTATVNLVFLKQFTRFENMALRQDYAGQAAPF